MNPLTLQVKNLFRPPKSFEEKTTGLVYVNSNCGAKSGRSEIMRKVSSPSHFFTHRKQSRIVAERQHEHSPSHMQQPRDTLAPVP